MASRKRAIVAGIVVGTAVLLLGGGFVAFAVGGPLVFASIVGVAAYFVVKRFM